MTIYDLTIFTGSLVVQGDAFTNIVVQGVRHRGRDKCLYCVLLGFVCRTRQIYLLSVRFRMSRIVCSILGWDQLDE